MVSINYSAREVCCKIVYYGPGLSGKTTNLQYVHAKVPQTSRGKLISLATEADRTLYFDFLPINIGTINGFTAKFQLYTVPGQVYYNATRKLVLRGVDGIVFVADSQPDKMDENIESLTNLEENLQEYGYDLNELPMVIQFNKRDLPGVMSVEALNARLNPRHLPHFEASASIGNGVFDTLKLVIRMVLEKAKTAQSPKSASAPETAPRAVPVVERVSEPIPEYPTARPMEAEAPRPPVEPVRQPAYVAPAASAERELRPVQEPEYEPAPQPVAVAHVPQQSLAARPYPGSRGEAPVERKSYPAAHRAPRQDGYSEQTQERDMSAEYGSSDRSWSGKTSPQMAPSLRRRNEMKKRGFFKRLFGIK